MRVSFYAGENSFRWSLYIGTIAALGLFFGTANPLWHLPPLILLYPIGLVLLACHAKTRKQAAWHSFLCGTLASAAALYWLAIPLHDVGMIPWLGTLPCIVGVGAYIGLTTALFGSLCHWLYPRFSYSSFGLLAGIAWAALECLRSVLFTGFPWLIVAAGFAPWPPFIQLASVIGAFGLSGILVCCSIWLYFGLRHLVQQRTRKKESTRPAHSSTNRDKQARWALQCGILIFLGLLSFGFLRLKEQPTQETTFTAVLVQANINQNQKWESSYQQATIDRHITLSLKGIEEARLQNKDSQILLIWPETVMPFYMQDESTLSQQVRQLAQTKNVSLLTGSVGYSLTEESLTVLDTNEQLLHNRALLYNQQGNLSRFYDKEHLVPFGEYIPFDINLPFLDYLKQGIASFYPSAATEPLPLTIQTASGENKTLSLGMLICYEAIFPALAQKRVEQGAVLLVNISNDAWFGKSSAPQQHLDLNILRAVEQNRPLLRSTSTGISTFVDAKGRIQDTRSRLFTAQALVIPVRLDTNPKHSIYFWLAPYLWPCLSILFLGACFIRRRTGN